MLDPLSVLDASDAKGELLLMHYEMWMQSLAISGQISGSFVLLARAEASGLLSYCDESCYSLFLSLLEACRMMHDSHGTSRVQAAMDRLGLIALA